jgi:hypothetical protein
VIELLVLAAVGVGVVTLLATLFGALSFAGWLVTLPFQILGWIFKGVGFVLALPFMLLGLVMGGVGMVVGLGAGAFGLAIGFGVLALVALPFLLPFVLIVLIVRMLRGPTPRRA